MKRNLKEKIGFTGVKGEAAEPYAELVRYINIKLAALDLSIFGNAEDYPFLEIGRSLLANLQVKNRLLGDYLCPVDQHIQDYLERTFADNGVTLRRTWLPTNTFTLEKHGLARTLSIPPDNDHFKSDIIQSYQTKNGVLHNPKSDRRTTKGVFHVAECGSPIPTDKKSVPLETFARMLDKALQPPEALLELPFTANSEEKARTWVSLLLRPRVCPEVDGLMKEKTMEVRFFAPGNMVANLDFVESIFGNAGNPLLPENDSRLDTDGWSGHTGCVILAPHLITLKKQDLALPHISEATERQKRDGMCWENPDELYNDGGAFKLTCRNHEGVVVTLIADNYFGYCKKEVKTQLSYAANMFGLVEEEHAGGAIAFPSYDLGEDFRLSYFYKDVKQTFATNVELFPDLMDIQAEGYGIDKQFPSIVYVPEDAHIDLRTQRVTWEDGEQEIKLLPDVSYVYPTGYKVKMVNPETGQRWRLVGSTAEGIVCHKPCTVSGGGKSEISKPISDAMVAGPVITDFDSDMDIVEEIIAKDYSKRYKEPLDPSKESRPLLSTERSLGSVIRLLTPDPEQHTEEFLAWLDTIPKRVRDLVLTLKRYYRPHWGDDWRKRFRVDLINGKPGSELRYRDRPVIASYVRMGYSQDSSWRTYSLRKDFWPAVKLQREDDITCSVTLPCSQLSNLPEREDRNSVKFVDNCEYRLFQRPDDAFVPGYDKHTEDDFSAGNAFFSNYEGLTRSQVKEIVEDAIRFSQFTKPMREMMESFISSDEGPDFMVVNSNPRLVDGKPTKNPRYLQNRPDLENAIGEYLADIGMRLQRQIPVGQYLATPVTAVLPGRRNNPPEPEAGIRPLAVYNPIHYQELPELFMDFIASLTGKSPSTTGAGSEGALTKGPFNALLPIVDVNNALVSYLITDSQAFSTAAGYVGHKYRMDHDISLIVPEIWCRLRDNERDANWLIQNNYLEGLKDFEHEGETIHASRLGFRMTELFARHLFGRVFSNPDTVFTEEMLKPEQQNFDYYIDGIKNICEAQRKAALNYFDDGSVDLACPPLRALLHIMATGDYEGKTIHDPEIRDMFTRESMLKSDWYHERLVTRYRIETNQLRKKLDYLQGYKREQPANEVERLGIDGKIDSVRARLNELERDPEAAIQKLVGTIGADPGLHPNLKA